MAEIDPINPENSKSSPSSGPEALEEEERLRSKGIGEQKRESEFTPKPEEQETKLSGVPRQEGGEGKEPEKAKQAEEGGPLPTQQVIDNKAPIAEQINAYGTINIFKDAPVRPDGSIRPEPPKDPTKNLPRPNQMDVPDFPIEEYPEFADLLERRRILLLSTFMKRTALAAAYSLVRLERFKAYECRMLTVPKISETSELDIAFVSREGYHEKRRQIILVEISGPCSFSDSLRLESYGEAAALREALTTKDILVVCAGSCEVLGASPEKAGSVSSMFDHYVIPFPIFELRRHYSKEAAETFASALEEQMLHGLWADCPKIDAFYQKISELVTKPEGFEEEFYRRESLAHKTSPIDKSDLLKPVSARDLFDSGDGVRRAVLFVAVYFDGLEPRDFDTIVRLILGADTAEIEKDRNVFDESGKTQQIREAVPRFQVDIWGDGPDDVLAQCSLVKSDSTRAITFSKAYLRDELIRHMEEAYPMFVERCFGRLQSKSFLFQAEASGPMIDGVISLVIKRTRNPDELLLSSFQTVASLEQGSILLGDAYDRLCRLLREMLREERHRESVNRFLDLLLRTRRHEDLLGIVLELAKKLRFMPEFEAFFWIRRLIDEGGSDVEQSAYRCLFGLARESGIHLYDVLSAIRSWLPDPGKAALSPSNRRSLRFLPEYCSNTSYGDFLDEHYGEWPSRYPLFAFLPSDPVSMRGRLDLIVRWLTHPDMKAAIDAGTEELADFLADLVEHWVLILEGTDSSKSHLYARQVGGALIEAFAEQVDRSVRTRFVRRWQLRQQAYYRRVNLLPIEARAERSALLAKRKKLLEVKQRFDDSVTKRQAGARGQLV